MGKNIFMIKKYFNNLEHNYLLIILLFFPLSVLFRSATLNLYFIILSLFFFFNLKSIKKINFEIWHYLFFILIIYLILISFFSNDFFSSFKNAISQFRFFFFILFLSSIRLDFEGIKKAYYVISYLIVLVCLDVIYQYLTGFDVFGFYPGVPGTNPHRLSGPFGEELIVGSYIFLISIPIISFFMNQYQSSSRKMKSYFFFFIFLTFFTILISGERMSLVLYLFGLILIIIYNFNLKNFFQIVCFLLLLLSIMFTFNKSVNYRFQSFFEQVVNFNKTDHFKLFSSSVEVWKTSPIIGVGLKNYRKECDEKKIDPKTNLYNLCSSHPHNIYLEILSETGLVGLLLVLVLFLSIFKSIYKKYRFIHYDLKGIFLGSLIIFVTYVWPIKSSGSFFTTFYGSFLWFNLAIISLILNNTKYR